MKSVFRVFLALTFVFATVAARADDPAVSFSLSDVTAYSGIPQSEGWTFTVNSPITVTALGWFNADGMVDSHPVTLFDSLGDSLASVTVTSSGTQNGDFIYESVTPVTLADGTYYIEGVPYSTDQYVSGPYADYSILTLNPDITFVTANWTNQNAGTGYYPAVPDGEYPVAGFFGPNFLTGSGATPEPSSLVLLGTGLIGACGAFRRRIRA